MVPMPRTPGGGWLNYDPTNRVTGGNELIPAAIARHPQQAVPLAGTWFGEPQDYLGMSVAISVRKLNTFLDDFEPRAPSGP